MHALSVASRMESSGVSGHVQLSAEAFAACDIDAALIPGAHREIKGKGTVTTHTLKAGGEADAAVRRALAVEAPDRRVAPAAPVPSPEDDAAPSIDSAGAPTADPDAAGGTAAAPSSPRTRRSVVAARWRRASAAALRLSEGAAAAADAAPPPPHPDHAAPSGGTSVDGGSSFKAEQPSAAAREASVEAVLLSHLAQQTLGQSVPPAVFWSYAALVTPGRWVSGVGELSPAAAPSLSRALSLFVPLMLLTYAVFFAFLATFALRRRLPKSVREWCAPRWAIAIVMCQAFVSLVTQTSHVFEVILRPSATGYRGATLRGCMRAQLGRVLVPMVCLPWLETQLPPKLLVFPLLLTAAHHVAFSAWLCSIEGGCDAAALAWSLLEASIYPILIPFLLSLCYAPSTAGVVLLAGADTCPPLCGLRASLVSPARDALLSTADALRASLFGGATLVDEASGRLLSANGFLAVGGALLLGGTPQLRTVADGFTHTFALVLLASAAGKLRPRLGGGGDGGSDGGPDGFRRGVFGRLYASAPSQLAAQLAAQRAEHDAAALEALRPALAVARGEGELLAAAFATLAELFPCASGFAAAAFAEGSGVACLSSLRCGAPDGSPAPGLAAAFPPDVGARPATAVRACCDVRSPAFGHVLDSAGSASPSSEPLALDSFSDWAAAAASGHDAARVVTIPLVAGPRALGALFLPSSYLLRNPLFFAILLTQHHRRSTLSLSQAS